MKLKTAQCANSRFHQCQKSLYVKPTRSDDRQKFHNENLYNLSYSFRTPGPCKYTDIQLHENRAAQKYLMYTHLIGSMECCCIALVFITGPNKMKCHVSSLLLINIYIFLRVSHHGGNTICHFNKLTYSIQP